MREESKPDLVVEREDGSSGAVPTGAAAASDDATPPSPPPAEAWRVASDEGGGPLGEAVALSTINPKELTSRIARHPVEPQRAALQVAFRLHTARLDRPPPTGEQLRKHTDRAIAAYAAMMGLTDAQMKLPEHLQAQATIRQHISKSTPEMTRMMEQVKGTRELIQELQSRWQDDLEPNKTKDTDGRNRLKPATPEDVRQKDGSYYADRQSDHSAATGCAIAVAFYQDHAIDTPVTFIPGRSIFGRTTQNQTRGFLETCLALGAPAPVMQDVKGKTLSLRYLSVRNRSLLRVMNMQDRLRTGLREANIIQSDTSTDEQRRLVQRATMAVLIHKRPTDKRLIKIYRESIADSDLIAHGKDLESSLGLSAGGGVSAAAETGDPIRDYLMEHKTELGLPESETFSWEDPNAEALNRASQPMNPHGSVVISLDEEGAIHLNPRKASLLDRAGSALNAKLFRRVHGSDNGRALAGAGIDLASRSTRDVQYLQRMLTEAVKAAKAEGAGPDAGMTQAQDFMKTAAKMEAKGRFAAPSGTANRIQSRDEDTILQLARAVLTSMGRDSDDMDAVTSLANAYRQGAGLLEIPADVADTPDLGAMRDALGTSEAASSGSTSADTSAASGSRVTETPPAPAAAGSGSPAGTRVSAEDVAGAPTGVRADVRAQVGAGESARGRAGEEGENVAGEDGRYSDEFKPGMPEK